MEGFGARLRARALELGLSDAEVARRAGLTPTRYGHYVTDYREPDLATLVRICQILGITPDSVLCVRMPGGGDDDLANRRWRLAGFAETLDGRSLEVALEIMQALAATVGLRTPADLKREEHLGPVASHGPSRSSPRRR